MKYRYYAWTIAVLIALGLLVAEAPGAAALLMGVTTFVEILVSIVRGKQSNDGMH